MRIFFDTEFTGLHQNTTLISIGLCTENGQEFYAELTDYDKSQLDPWISEHVIAKLTGQNQMTLPELKVKLTAWFESLTPKGDVVAGSPHLFMWSDCLAYDWVLFNNIFGGAFGIPKDVYYIPFDLSTLLALKAIDPDISRELYAGVSDSRKHNSLHDAHVIGICVDKAMEA